MINEKYDVVIGLEIHAQLQTHSKLFCGDSIQFGAEPNTQVSPVTLGHPGTLPKTNIKAIEYATRLGLALGCNIVTKNYFARKNYFYPDLPKGYQISQHTTPICKGGSVEIMVNGVEKSIILNRIHIEEDAGKSIHDNYENETCVDLNRAGTPLLEIVTEPCINSSEEAFQYITEVRKIVRWLNVCDGNMEEGSLRCDANVSIKPKGALELGTKVEVKNLNSIRNVKKAIDAEVKRMIHLVENGGTVIQQTRTYNIETDTTSAIRDKEDANDYRYFADPDLTPFNISQEYIANIRNKLPILPMQWKQKLQKQYGLSFYDANIICEDKSLIEIFVETISIINKPKSVANFIIGPIKEYINTSNLELNHTKLTHQNLAILVQLVDEGKVNFSVASSKILPKLFIEDTNPEIIAHHENLLQTNDESEVEIWVCKVINSMPEKVEEYKKGKKGLIGLFVGEVKKISKGKAEPKVVTSILQQKLR